MAKEVKKKTIKDSSNIEEEKKVKASSTTKKKTDDSKKKSTGSKKKSTKVNDKKTSSKKVVDTKKKDTDTKKKNTDTKKKAVKKDSKNTKSTTTKKAIKNSSSILIDNVDNNLENTGAIKNVNESAFVSEVLDNKEAKSKKEVKEDNSKIEKEESFNGQFTFDVLDIAIIVVITAIVSCVLTGIIINYQYKKTAQYLDSTVLADKNVKEFISLYEEILNNYYEEVDSDAMMKAAIKGMVEHLEDTYSIYISGEESGGVEGIIDNSYEGIGVVAQSNRIVGVYKNSPAAQAGIKVNDEIVSINDTVIDSKNYVDIGDYLKKDGENKIVIKREDKELTFTVTMAKVNIPTAASTTVDYDCKDNGESCKHVGYIKISSFSFLSYEDFQESLVEIEKDGIDSLIIDLRSNTGGYLKAAYDIANLFVEKGKIIYSLEQKKKVTDYKATNIDKKNYKIVVLVNNSTASASEVLAAALHDSYGATIVGKTTYGKGTVQNLKELGDESVVKYTSAKWLKPDGECINGIGITPDIEVNIEYDSSQIYDKQLDKAIELLTK